MFKKVLATGAIILPLVLTSCAYDFGGVCANPSIALETQITAQIEIVSGPNGASANGNIAGSELHYEYTVTNTGDVTLKNITLSDDFNGTIELPKDSLLAGETVQFSIVSAAVKNGKIVYTATVTGYYKGVPYSDTYTAEFILVPAPADAGPETGPVPELYPY